MSYLVYFSFKCISKYHLNGDSCLSNIGVHCCTLCRKNIEIPILRSSARVAARLNYLCPQLFPAPGFWSLQQMKMLSSASEFASKVQYVEIVSGVS